MVTMKVSVALLAVAAYVIVHIRAKERHIVETTCGRVRGRHIQGAYSFRGIPYAEPPLANRRWRAPVPLSRENGNCWKETFKARHYGSACYQRNIINPTIYEGDEDCLYLNVVSPTLDPEAEKPVVVWIHGGWLNHLSANVPGYMPTEKTAVDTDMVYVAFNYRLNAFGFMALQMFADQSPQNTSGNYGFMDQIEVLKWVRDNIRNFGGDPNKVTLCGQSSGGTSVFALLSSPLATGLFHNAWSMSGSAILNKTAAEAFVDNEIFVHNTGCSDVQCLYDLPAEQVLRSVPWDEYPYWAMAGQVDLPVKNYFDGALPVVDGYVLPEPIFDSWAKGIGSDVPVLLGSTENELDMAPVDNAVANWTWTDYENHLNKTMGTFGNLILNTALKLYPSGYLTPEYQLTSITSDVRCNCPNDVLAAFLAGNIKSPVYRYVVTSFPSDGIEYIGVPFKARYAFHGWDTAAFFGDIPYYLENPTDEDWQFEAMVRHDVLSFIRNGHPASVEWKPYPLKTALMSANTTAVDAFHPVQCEFLLHNGFFSYSWLN